MTSFDAHQRPHASGRTAAVSVREAEPSVGRARRSGAAVLCLHTSELMTAAVAMYEAMGFRRVPSFDFVPGGPARGDGQRLTVIAYRLDL